MVSCIPLSHPHLTSPTRGASARAARQGGGTRFEVLGKLGKQVPPLRGLPEATRSAGGASLMPIFSHQVAPIYGQSA